MYGLGYPEQDWVFNFGPAKVLGHSIFHRTSLSVVFVNKKPVVPGHVLVSPVRLVTASGRVSQKQRKIPVEEM